MGSATPSQSGVGKQKGIAAGGRPGPAPDSRGGGERTSEGTNPCTRPSFATKNVFDVLQDLSESIEGSPGRQLDAADGQPEPIVHDLHQSLVELLERPEILSLYAVRRVGRERQLHLKVRALCGEVEKVFDVLVDTGAQVSLVKAGLLPPECLTDSRKPVRLKVANGQYMVGGTKEAAIGLQFVNHRELSRPDLGKEILLQGRFYKAEMDWDMIVGYDFMRFEVRGLILRVLDAFRPRGATWSGQVISSPPGPSGGPSKSHLLPGGGVPRVHRARSPVLPRRPRFATPRSVHQFAAVPAGAYPLRRPPNAWSPGAPAPPGPCYWLVAGGTPLGWRGGCLA